MSEIITCVADYMGIEETQISGETDLQNDLGLSSFDVMDLSCELEEHFNVKIEAEKLSELHCVKDIYNLLNQYN